MTRVTTCTLRKVDHQGFHIHADVRENAGPQRLKDAEPPPGGFVPPRLISYERTTTADIVLNPAFCFPVAATVSGSGVTRIRGTDANGNSGLVDIHNSVTWTFAAVDVIPAGAGALLYRNDDGTIWVLLGYDKNHRVWCDFGGGYIGGKYIGDEYIDDHGDIRTTAMRELKEETRDVYGDTVPVTLLEPYQAAVPYFQYVCQVPFRRVSVLMGSSPQKKSPGYDEMISYMWIPLETLFDAVNARPNKDDYRDIELPKEYILSDVMPGKHRPIRQILRAELAETLDTFRTHADLRDKYFK